MWGQGGGWDGVVKRARRGCVDPDGGVCQSYWGTRAADLNDWKNGSREDASGAGWADGLLSMSTIQDLGRVSNTNRRDCKESTSRAVDTLVPQLADVTWESGLGRIIDGFAHDGASIGGGRSD